MSINCWIVGIYIFGNSVIRVDGFRSFRVQMPKKHIHTHKPCSLVQWIRWNFKSIDFSKAFYLIFNPYLFEAIWSKCLYFSRSTLSGVMHEWGLNLTWNRFYFGRTRTMFPVFFARSRFVAIVWHIANQHESVFVLLPFSTKQTKSDFSIFQMETGISMTSMIDGTDISF